ncbi:MAG: adenosylcobinamide amidohydrolase [Acidimicrobiales bacterium]
MIEPVLLRAADDHQGVLLWRFDPSVAAVSSAPVGGGFTTADWVVNTGVTRHYRRTDLAAHVSEIAAGSELEGSGVGLFTAADVGRHRRGSCEGVVVDATVGISKPTWASDPGGGWNTVDPAPGTINAVAQVSVPLAPAAAINAVITVTEAKTQALLEAGIPGTGTASDAVVILWPRVGEPAPFAGPRSPWGTRLAQATLQAVAAGIEASR